MPKKSNTVRILALIDIQNGFARSDLTPEQGGSLYVPEGEKVGEPAAKLIRELKDGYVILSQDHHPRHHISFASQHKDMEPKGKIILRQRKNGVYHAIGAVVDNKVMAVLPTPDGFIAEIKDIQVLSKKLDDKSLQQDLWPDHCVQNTESELFVPEIMQELPPGMKQSLTDPSQKDATWFFDQDLRGNKFLVVRKGAKNNLDSYGIGTENDQVSTTAAPTLFRKIAKDLAERKTKNVEILIGGLATNFCVEFSNTDIQKYLVPALREKGIKAQVFFVPEISRGVPIPISSGEWPDLAAAPKRMMEKGTLIKPLAKVARL